MEQAIEYYAFISYKSEDVEWAIWLQHELEHYHLPASLNGRTDIRQKLRPVFRDIDELSAGNLPEQIRRVLKNSQNLVVICSPQSAVSPWVNQEIETFISLGRTDRIFPFIVDGKKPKEFFPPALMNLPKSEERLGGDVGKNGRDAAFVKVVSGMLGVNFDSLWNRYEKEKAEEERKQREQRDALLRIQSCFIAEKARALTNSGDSYLARKLISVSVSPDSKCVMSTAGFHNSKDDTIRIWDIETGILIRTIKNDGWSVYYACFSPNGKQIVSASEGRSVCIWDGINSLFPRFLQAHTWPVNMAVFSPDGKLVVSAAADNTIKIWEVSSGKVLHTLIEHLDNVRSVSFSPDGVCLVSASNDKTVRIWNVLKGRLLQTLVGHTGKVESAVFSPNGKLVVSTSSDKTVRIWDVATGTSISTLEGHAGGIHSVCFSPDATCFITSSEDGSVHVWDISSCLPKSAPTLNKKAQKIISNPDYSKNVEAAGRYISIWSAGYQQLFYNIEAHSEDIQSIAFSSDAKRIVSTSTDYTVRIWNAHNGKMLQSIDIPVKEVSNALFSPDGSRIFVSMVDGGVFTIDIATGRIINTFEPSQAIENNSKNSQTVSLQELIDENKRRFNENPLTPEERKQYYLE